MNIVGDQVCNPRQKVCLTNVYDAEKLDAVMADERCPLDSSVIKQRFDGFEKVALRQQ